MVEARFFKKNFKVSIKLLKDFGNMLNSGIPNEIQAIFIIFVTVTICDDEEEIELDDLDSLPPIPFISRYISKQNTLNTNHHYYPFQSFEF